MEEKDNNQDEEKEINNKQWIGDLAKENNKENNIENKENTNNNTKELIKSYKDINKNITKSKSANNIKEIKIINKPNLNYDYGDSIDSIYFNEITNSNIKYNINTINATNKKINEVINNNKYKNDEINNNPDKIINIKHDYFSIKKNIDSSSTKPYYNLYDEFKNKYKNNNEIKTPENNSLSQRTYFTNYINNSVQRNYLTFNPHNSSNNLSYNILDNQFQTPMRNEFENKKDNINLNFSDYKINSYNPYIPNKYFDINSDKNDINSAKIIYLEKQISAQQKIIKKYENDIYMYMTEIKMYKNTVKIISDFFELISKKYIPELNSKNKIIEINDENSLNSYFKKLEEYITNINKELNEYKYKYQKLLDLDSSLHSTIKKQNKIKEIKKQNTFPENNETINEKYLNNFESTNSNNDIDIYRTLEQRVFVLENELFNNKKINEKNSNIKNKTSSKILIKKNKKKKLNEDKYSNYNIKVKVNKDRNIMTHPIKSSKTNINNKSKTVIKNKLSKTSRQKKK